jgi:LPS sulfotransferase NodH
MGRRAARRVAVRPTTALVVCTSPRTGSGLLCSTLWSSGRCGQPDEYFADAARVAYEAEWGCRGDRGYLEALLDRTTTPNGVFAVKLHRAHASNVRWLDEVLGGDGVSASDTLAALAPRVHFVWLSRRDRVRQAVSTYLAARSGRYRSYDEARLVGDDIVLDRSAIDLAIEQIGEVEAAWASDFAASGVQPLRLWYEDALEHDPVAVARSVLEWIGVDTSGDLVLESPYEKQSDATSERLVREYVRSTTTDA